MNRINDITRIAFVASLYVVITLLCAPLAYDMVQFRISEALVLLAFYRKDYSIGLVIGCFIANWLGPFGITDAIFGTLATLLAVVCIMYSKNLYIASLYPVIFNGLVIGFELNYLYGYDFIISALWVALGEFVCICIFGVILFKFLERKEYFYEYIRANQNIKQIN